MLYNKEFLKCLDYYPNKTKYVRLIALDRDERPIETIEGCATGGSISIDGASKKQRTCSGITLLGQDLKINDVNWALKSKFKVEVGLKNEIDPTQPDIIWFNQGIYGINSFSVSENINSFNVSIGGQDKMGYLDGTFGGILPMQVDFGTEDFIQPDGSIISTKIPIYRIIQRAVHEFGQEPLQNIIINDLDDYGYELWDYRGSNETPMYYFYNINTGKVENMTFNGDMLVYSQGNYFALKNLKEHQLYVQNTNFSTGTSFKLSTNSNNEYKISKISYGESAGYHQTPLTYAGDLVLNAGDNVVSLLTKITTMLGEYEFFYDLNGKFVFQKKKNYVQGLLSPITSTGIIPYIEASPYSYEFTDTKLFSSVSRSPNIKDVKNDFIIWGNRKNATGVDVPIHLRFAVKKRPTQYTMAFPYYERIFLYGIEIISMDDIPELPKGYIWYVADGTKYRPATEEEITAKQGLVIIKESYDSSKDSYYKENNEYIKYNNTQLYCINDSHKFIEYTITNNSSISPELFVIADNIKTYTNSEVDWRELIYIMAREYYQHNQNSDFLIKVQVANNWCKEGRTGYEPFYADVQGFWRQLYDLNPKDRDQYLTSGVYKGWNKNAIYSPSSVNFWLEFLEPEGEIDMYSIDNIGLKTKVENKNDITALFYELIPSVQFIINPTETYVQGSLDNTPLWISDTVQELFTISGRGISASEHLESLIYKHLYCTESLNLTSVPIYYLEPNTRIYVKDEEANVDGDYLLTKISIPLSYNGTMSLTCNKVIKNIGGNYTSNEMENTSIGNALQDLYGCYLLDSIRKYLIAEESEANG